MPAEMQVAYRERKGVATFFDRHATVTLALEGARQQDDERAEQTTRQEQKTRQPSMRKSGKRRPTNKKRLSTGSGSSREWAKSTSTTSPASSAASPATRRTMFSSFNVDNVRDALRVAHGDDAEQLVRLSRSS
jgi:hypothetical protein